jgi:ABC-2 type transport system ATP-binding protein
LNPIAIESLSKRYGTFEAVRDVSFEVPAGSICGLLGPNGSGKSTTFKCLLGLARADAGHISIDGGPPRAAM